MRRQVGNRSRAPGQQNRGGQHRSQIPESH
jgi:hypothetical protein